MLIVHFTCHERIVRGAPNPLNCSKSKQIRTPRRLGDFTQRSVASRNWKRFERSREVWEANPGTDTDSHGRTRTDTDGHEVCVCPRESVLVCVPKSQTPHVPSACPLLPPPASLVRLAAEGTAVMTESR